MKKIDFIKKMFLFALIVVLLLYVNHVLNIGFFGTLIETYALGIAACIGLIFTGIYFWIGVEKSVRNSVYSKSQKIWKETLSDINIGLEQEYRNHVLELEEDNIRLLKFGVQYFIVQKKEEQINNTLSMLRDEFYNKTCCRDEISYFFLSGRKNNSISAFLYENKKFKEDCETVSFEISRRNSYEQFNGKGNILHLLNELSIEILHMSLLENHIDIEKNMDYLCKLFSWLYDQIAIGVIPTESVSFLSFLQSLPCLEEKMESLEVEHKMLFQQISKIRKSRDVKKAIRYAERALREGEKHNIDECICFAGIILKYPEKFSLMEQVKFCKKIERARRDYREKYHVYCEYSIIILLMASPLGMKSPVDNVDGVISIITALMKVCDLKL